MRSETVDAAVTAHTADRAVGAAFRVRIGEESNSRFAATDGVCLQPVVAVGGPRMTYLDVARACGVRPITAPCPRLDTLTGRPCQNVVIIHFGSIWGMVGNAVFVRQVIHNG